MSEYLTYLCFLHHELESIDQSRHTYNFKPEPRMSDRLHTSYDEAYAPRLSHRPDRPDGANFFAVNNIGNRLTESEKWSRT